ncbi:MAG: alpha-galactosidase, partial [Chloroflexota bacterium]|nr:alpha-galactosidase [Chloroflexota bacterium]
LDSQALELPVVQGEAGDVTTVRWRMTPEGAPVSLTWTIEGYARHSVVRQWVEVANDGPDAVQITSLPVLSWVFGGATWPLTAHRGLGRRSYRGSRDWSGWHGWRSLALGSGVYDAVESGYRRDATWLGLTSTEGGPGLFLGWEANTRATCRFGDLRQDGAVAIECGLAPAYRLESGQTLTGPAGFTGLVSGDLDELSYRSQRFVDDVLAWKAKDERFPFVEFNSWGYETDIDDASMRRCFAICQKLGIELFVVDFGWEDPDWKPLPDIFPHGLAPLAAAAHEAGMLFGVHLSFGNVSSLSAMYRDHPDWANGPGQWAYRREGEVFGLTLGNPAPREWIVDKLVEIVDDLGIDYFLTDHELWGPTNPAVQERHATDDYLTVAEGYDLVLERFHARRPNVLIEHCDDGMGLPTFKMVRQHVTSIGADAAGSLKERMHTWRFSRIFPPRYLDHYVCDRPLPHMYVGTGLTEYDYRSHMFGGPMILMTNIGTIEEGSADWTALTRSIDLFKRVRHNVLEGKVLHLLEPQPLEQVGRRWDGWDAIGSYHEASDTAAIFVFRLGGETSTRTIPLHGLQPDTTYRVTFEDGTETLHLTGSQLMAEGLPVTLPRPGQPPIIDANGMVRGSDVVFLEPAAGEVEGE